MLIKSDAAEMPRLDVLDEEFSLAPTVDLIPGMPVEVLIVTERRTMFDYISKPFRDAFWRSFREI
jgi:hypothetical protein